MFVTVTLIRIRSNKIITTLTPLKDLYPNSVLVGIKEFIVVKEYSPNTVKI